MRTELSKMPAGTHQERGGPDSIAAGKEPGAAQTCVNPNPLITRPLRHPNCHRIRFLRASSRQLRVHSTGMHSGSEDKQFFFEEQPAGYFEDELPSSPGEYRYMPLRGPGHLRLVEALASSGSQRCYYLVEGKKQYFIVLKALSDGMVLVHAHPHVSVDEG
jgi:hypothetical protein